MAGDILIFAAAFFTGLQTGIIYAWPRGLFVQTADGTSQAHLTPQDEIFIINTLPVFKVIGATLCAYLMETQGRRMTLIVLCGLGVISWAPNFMGASVGWYCFSHSFHGLFTNTFDSVMSIFIGETIKAEVRGAVCTLTSTAMAIGKLSITVLTKTNYTTFIALPIIPSLVTLISVLALKETPYFIMLKKGKDEARKSFILLRGHCNEEDLSRIEDRIQLLSKDTRSFKELLRGSTRKSLGIIILFAILAKLSGSDSISSLISSLVPNSPIPYTTVALIMSICTLFANVTAMLLVDRVGRKPLSFISFVGSGLVLFFAAVWFYLHDQTSAKSALTHYNWIPIALFALEEIFSNIGSHHLYHILMGELLSVEVCGRASMIVTISSSATLLLVNQAFYSVKRAYGTSCVMLACSAFNLIGCVCIRMLLFETRGKTLEEIQCTVNRNRATSEKLSTAQMSVELEGL